MTAEGGFYYETPLMRVFSPPVGRQRTTAGRLRKTKRCVFGKRPTGAPVEDGFCYETPLMRVFSPPVGRLKFVNVLATNGIIVFARGSANPEPRGRGRRFFVAN